MLSLAQALDRRGAAGEPLPTVWPKLAAAGADICRSQFSMIVGPPSAGKSLVTWNMLARTGVPSLGFLLDTNETEAACRFTSIATGKDYRAIKNEILNGQEKGHQEALRGQLAHVQVVFYAPSPEEVEREIKAYEQRYGLPPEFVLLDNLGNQTSGFDPEWPVLKALSLEYADIARRAQCAIVACHHTTDLETAEPAQRSKILGKITQYATLILSVAYNSRTTEYKIAIVKNREGETDARAERPLTFYADPARMLLSEEPVVHPQVLFARQQSQWN